jgi:hypothetical protein
MDHETFWQSADATPSLARNEKYTETRRAKRSARRSQGSFLRLLGRKSQGIGRLARSCFPLVAAGSHARQPKAPLTKRGPNPARALAMKSQPLRLKCNTRRESSALSTGDNTLVGLWQLKAIFLILKRYLRDHSSSECREQLPPACYRRRGRPPGIRPS